VELSALYAVQQSTDQHMRSLRSASFLVLVHWKERELGASLTLLAYRYDENPSYRYNVRFESWLICCFLFDVYQQRWRVTELCLLSKVWMRSLIYSTHGRGYITLRWPDIDCRHFQLYGFVTL